MNLDEIDMGPPLQQDAVRRTRESKDKAVSQSTVDDTGAYAVDSVNTINNLPS